MKKKFDWALFSLYLIALLLPFVIGVPISLIQKDFTILEIILVLFGLFEMLIAVISSRTREKNNYKKNKTLFEDKSTDEYKKYKRNKIRLYILAIVTLCLSLVIFLIFNR